MAIPVTVRIIMGQMHKPISERLQLILSRACVGSYKSLQGLFARCGVREMQVGFLKHG